MATLLSAALMSGCVTTSGDFCDTARPMYFSDVGVVEWLGEHDPALLRRVTAYNESAATCP